MGPMLLSVVRRCLLFGGVLYLFHAVFAMKLFVGCLEMLVAKRCLFVEVSPLLE